MSAQSTFSRREFMRMSVQIGVGAFGALTVMPAPTNLVSGRAAAARRSAGPVREVYLEAREVAWELSPGKRVQAFGFNGTIPGPEIRVREGERVRVVMRNALSEPTTIHWHGVDVPNPMDGVPGVTQPPVEPGETFVYDFVARPAGTRWYHTHFNSPKQLDLGLYAALIIEPAQPESSASDREYTLVLDDWATGMGPVVPDTREGVAGFLRAGADGPMGRMMRDMMGPPRVAYDTMTINGKAYPATQPLKVRRGERIRLRFINVSADHTHVIRLAGHRLQVTHTDGNPLVRPVEVEALPIAPSERYDVMFVADRPGAWFLSCAAPSHAGAGEQVPLIYDGWEGSNLEAPSTRIAGATVWQYGMGRGRELLATPLGRDYNYNLTLSGGMMGSDVWTINGQSYPATERMKLQAGDRARVRLINMSMEAHPMHLHGQSFKVLAVNGRRLPAALVKDSVDVAPHMGSVDLEFIARSSGDWLFDCHKPMHMEGGMMTLVRIV